VQEFRVRRGRPSLPFPTDDLEPETGEFAAPAESVSEREQKQENRLAAAPARRAGAQSRTPLQPQDMLGFPDSVTGALDVEFSTPPVASFRTRLTADALDLALMLIATLVCLLPLSLLADDVVWNRYVIAGCAAAGCVVALLYGVVFVYLAGATPAMRHMRLRLVNFDGQPATREERLWRLLGSVASAGSFLLGFVWAAMDDERFSWHDRISRTFLTTASQAGSAEKR
jgi:uncharacterized RDD family membrane protein YckC